VRPEDSPGFLLWRVVLRWQREVTAALAPFSLTHVQFVLLASVWWLNGHGEQPTQQAVAAHAGTDVKMTSEVLRRLEAKGLVTRSIDGADARVRRSKVTARGGRLASRAVTAVESVDAVFFGPTPSVLDVLRQLADGQSP
jgi:DNA-binding MarR family transcriptional regulator